MDKTLVKGLRLIELLAQAEKPRALTGLAKDLSLTKSNVHRLLATLQANGYVRQIAQLGSYELTSKVWEFGSLYMSKLDISVQARAPMVELAERTQETVQLSILDEGEVVYIDKIDSLHPVRAHTRVGGRAPAWCVATGKAMLAFQPADYLERCGRKLEAFTDTTLACPARLRDELASIRDKGVAMNRGEWREDVWGVAAPVFDRSREVVGAIGISGPAIRMGEVRMTQFSADVAKAAAAVSAAMGYHGAGEGWNRPKAPSPREVDWAIEYVI